MAQSINRKVTIYVNGKEVENTIKSLRAELKRLENQQKNCTIGSEEYMRVTSEISRLRGILTEASDNAARLGKEWKTTVEKAAEFSNILMGLQSGFQMIDMGIGKLKDLAKDAATLDDVYADVMKTTGLTHEEVERLNEAFKKMDTRTSREQLNQLAYEAGKLGLNSAEAVAQFVSASDKINIALGDVLGEGAMVTIGKLTNIFETSTTALAGKNLEEKMLAIGSAVNSLGQASTANEGYLVEFMKRLGGIAAQAGLSADQILGYASALDQNGQAVEMSATAFTKMIMQMVKKPEEFVKAAGMSLTEFQQMMDRDMNGAIQRVLEGMDAQGGFQQIVQMFNEMGLDGSRAAQAISSLAKHLDQVREAQALASEEIRTGSSVVNEFNTKNETMQAEAEKARKKFQDIRIELGNELYPVLIHLQKTGTVFMKMFATLAEVVKNNHWILLSFTTALVALNLAKMRAFAADKAKIVQDRIKAALDKAEVTTTKLKTAAQGQSTLATLRLQKARIILASSNREVRYTIDGISYASDKLTAKRNIDLAITRQQIAANKSLGVAMKAMPWGWVITALTAIVPLAYKWATHQSAVNKALDEAETQAGEAEGKIKVLVERMRRATEGSIEYTEALNELKREYPDIISLHTDEKGAIRDLEAAYKDLSAAARQSAYDRVYAEESASVYSTAAKRFVSYTEKMDAELEHFLSSQGVKIRDLSQVEIEEVRKRIHKAVSGLKDGEAVENVQQAVKNIVKELGGNSDLIGNEVGSRFMDYINQIASAYQKGDETLKRLKEALQPEENDPFGLMNKSLEELESELKTAKASMESMKSMWEKWKKDAPDNENTKRFGENYLQEKKHVDALTAAIKRLKKAQEDSGGTTTTTTPTGGVDEKELKKWERVKDRAEKLIADFGVKAESGLKRVQDEVRARRDAMLKDIDEAVGATEAQKEALKAQVADAAAALERSKVAEYIKKQTAELEKMKRSLKGEKVENDYLNRMEEAARNLQTTLAQIDEAILKAEADSANATGEEKQQLEALIATYRQLKAEMQATVYSRIDTTVQAKPVGSGESKFSSDTQAKVDTKQKSGLGMLFDKSAFTAYGKAIESIGEKYTAQAKKIGEARAAEDAIIARLQAKRMLETDPANQLLLDAEIAKHKEKAATLDEEKAKLDEFKQKAEQVAEEDAFGNALDRWIAGIEAFGQQALQLWGSINTLLNNSTEKERKEAEKQKDDNLKRLDEELEQGIISQEDYEEQKEAIQTEYDEKEKELQLEQWRRQKALNIGQATMEGALAVLKALSSAPPPYNAILAGISAALAAVQIAAIASEPEPYARGGYVPKRTVYQAGEAGPEWVASNSLLQDPTAAPIIEQLEQYQRGNRRALADIPMAQVNMPVATRAAQELGRRRSLAESSVAAAVQQMPQQVSVNMPQDGEMLSLVRELATYLKDPKNRQAVISRQTMTDFEKKEDFLRNRARL